MGNFQSFSSGLPINKYSYQICASKAEGRPVFKNNSLASTPETKPSMSLSDFRKISWYFVLSAGDTTHYGEKKCKIGCTSVTFHKCNRNILLLNTKCTYLCWWCFGWQEAYRRYWLMSILTGCWRRDQLYCTWKAGSFSFRRWHQCWRQGHWHRFLLKSTVYQEHGLRNDRESIKMIVNLLQQPKRTRASKHLTSKFLWQVLLPY